MSRTTFSGPVASDNGFIGDVTGNVTGSLTGTASAVSGIVVASLLQAPVTTSTALGAKANAVNTTGKLAGTTYYNTTTKTFYVAQGPTDTAKWVDAADGTTEITPA